MLCKGKTEARGRLKDYDPPMDWTLSGEAKRYIENSVIATSPACNAKANVETIDAIVDRLKRCWERPTSQIPNIKFRSLPKEDFAVDA